MKQSKKATSAEQRRKHRLVFLLNDDELQLVSRYIDRYNISNKSHWLRETVIRAIHKHLADDYPTLFREHDMRR